jgi:hypothetical protein
MGGDGIGNGNYEGGSRIGSVILMIVVFVVFMVATVAVMGDWNRMWHSVLHAVASCDGLVMDAPKKYGGGDNTYGRRGRKESHRGSKPKILTFDFSPSSNSF